MLKRHCTHSIHSLQKVVLFFSLLFVAATVSAQQNNLNSNSHHKPLNPLLYNSFKMRVQANPLLEAYIKPTRFELMYWPNYPLTAAQIAARDRRYEQSVGQQIAGQIIETTINSLIYGRKTPVAARPRF